MLNDWEPDFDLCDNPGCENVAHEGSDWGLNYCGSGCRKNHGEKLATESEHERIAEITSGGQV